MKLPILALVVTVALLSENALSSAAGFHVTGNVPADVERVSHGYFVADDHGPQAKAAPRTKTSKEGEQQLLNRLEQQLLVKEKELSALREEKARANNLLSTEKTRIGALEGQLTQKEQELRVLRDQGESQGQLSQELTAVRSSLQQAKQQIEDLERQLAFSNLEHAIRRIGQLEHRLDSKDREIAALRSAADEGSKFKSDQVVQREELTQANRRVVGLEQQLAGKEQELTQAKQRAAGLDQQLAGKEQELTQVNQRAAGLDQQLAGKEQELTQVNQRAAGLDQQLAGKEQELTQVKDNLAKVTQKLEELEQHLTARSTELAQTKQLLADLERNLTKQGETVHPPDIKPGDRIAQNAGEGLPPDPGITVTNLIPDKAVRRSNAEAASNDVAKAVETISSILEDEIKQGNVALQQRKNKLMLTLASGELFASGDATMTVGGTSLLEQIGTVLQKVSYQSIEVAGHTDNIPVRSDPRKTFRDNSELSQARAEHASQALVNGGIDGARIKAVGYAATRPIASNDTDKGRSKNRRVEIVITLSESVEHSAHAKTPSGKTTGQSVSLNAPRKP